MKVRSFLNDGPGRFWRYNPGDRLHEGPVVSLEARSEAEALALVWNVGNRVGGADEPIVFGDNDRPEWPSFVRSLSAGDVLVIGESAWSVATVGFEPVNGDDLARSLGRDAVDDPRGGFGPPAKSRKEAGL